MMSTLLRVRTVTNYAQKRLKSGALQRFAYNLSGFNKLGLMRDDLLNFADKDVIEALKRLPEDVVMERNYRILRAVQLGIQRDILPKKEWAKIEDDVLYLTPIVEDIIREREEREEWERTH